ncbi:MAG: hypothetical protein OXG80_02480 [Chloroflexi bacterium]|nr:hypothetical protein [Chloroflexota bacterium]
MTRNGNIAGGGSNRLPATIKSGAITRELTQHAIDKPHHGITAAIIEHVLDNWVIRGIKTDALGRQSMCYLAFAPQLGKTVRVAVSMDGSRIITAFPDDAATGHWNKGNLSYFVKRYQNLEVRDAS